MEIYIDSYQTPVLSTVSTFVSSQDQDFSDNARSNRSYDDSRDGIRVKARYKKDTMRFRLSLDSTFVKLKEEVAERVNIELDSFDVKGLDDDHEWIWITCDEDVQELVDISRKSGNDILCLLVTDRVRFQTLNESNDDGNCANRLANTSSKRNAETRDCLVISSYDDLKQHFGKKLNDVAENLGVSRSTIKRYCRRYGISRWPAHKRSKVAQINTPLPLNNGYLSQLENVCNVDEVARKDDSKSVTIKATCDGHPMLKFPLRHKSKVMELEENVTSRLKLEAGSLTMMYQDEDLDWILIACDADLQYAIDTLTLLGRTTIKIICHKTNGMMIV